MLGVPRLAWRVFVLAGVFAACDLVDAFFADAFDVCGVFLVPTLVGGVADFLSGVTGVVFRDVSAFSADGVRERLAGDLSLLVVLSAVAVVNVLSLFEAILIGEDILGDLFRFRGIPDSASRSNADMRFNKLPFKGTTLIF